MASSIHWGVLEHIPVGKGQDCRYQKQHILQMQVFLLDITKLFPGDLVEGWLLEDYCTS